MTEYDDYDYSIFDDGPEPPVDEVRLEAIKEIEDIFKENGDKVFFSRQIEIWLEDKYFHWISNKAIRDMVSRRIIISEERKLKTGGRIKLLWNPRNRYYKRDATKVVKLVEEYANPNISGAIGLHGEAMVLEGFARHEFVMKGRNTRIYRGKEWRNSEHNMDFIFERDGVGYGVEVKNTLGYMDHDEFQIKIRLCKHLGIWPVFVARMLPKTWIKEVVDSRGFGLIMKYQLYPWTHRELAKKVAKEFGIPVDSPKVIADGTMARFMKWHRKKV
jgi:hypothetical protein